MITWAADDLTDPSRPSVESITAAGQPFSLPWGHEERVLLTGLDSARIKKDAKEGPWTQMMAFDPSNTAARTVLSDVEGGVYSYSEAVSSSSTDSTDHLSAALALTVGYPFLSAGVQAKYDKTVTANESGVNASRNGTVRLGRVVLDASPPLSTTAIQLLRSPNEADALLRFRRAFGDYYVCGYELGADAGACLSATTQATSSESRLAVAASVKILFLEAKTPELVTTTSEATFNDALTFSSYCTLDASARTAKLSASSPQDLARLKSQTGAALKKVASLEQDARQTSIMLGIEHGARLDLPRCASVCRSGLVVGLLLAPYTALNDFVLHYNAGEAARAKVRAQSTTKLVTSYLPVR